MIVPAMPKLNAIQKEAVRGASPILKPKTIRYLSYLRKDRRDAPQKA